MPTPQRKREPATVGEPEDDRPTYPVVPEPDVEVVAAADLLADSPLDDGPAEVPVETDEDLQVALAARGSGLVKDLADGHDPVRIQFTGTNWPELEAALGADVRFNDLGIQVRLLPGADDFSGWVTIPEHTWVLRATPADKPFLLTPDAMRQLHLADG